MHYIVIITFFSITYKPFYEFFSFLPFFHGSFRLLLIIIAIFSANVNIIQSRFHNGNGFDVYSSSFFIPKINLKNPERNPGLFIITTFICNPSLSDIFILYSER